jgi:hypothetical protein
LEISVVPVAEPRDSQIPPESEKPLGDAPA